MKKRMLLWSFVTAIPMLVAIRLSLAQDPSSPANAVVAHGTKPLKIVPIVVLKPGETTKLLLSTHCTVGGTRGGGFEFAAMKDAKPRRGRPQATQARPTKRTALR